MTGSRIGRWLTRLAAAGLLVIAVTTAMLSSRTAEPASAATYADKASWVTSALGDTLRIDPSPLARTLGIAAARGVMNNALSLAGEPPYSSAIYASLFEQLQCHLALIGQDAVQPRYLATQRAFCERTRARM